MRRRSRTRAWVTYGLLLAAAALLLAVLVRPPDRGDRYIALGDSYAAGVGATALRGYAPRFADWLQGGHGRRVPTFLNMGVGGESSTSLLENGQLAQALDAIGDDNSATRVVTVNIGTNELLAPECLGGVNVPKCRFKENFTAIVDELQTALKDEPESSQLLVMGLFAPFPDAGPIAVRSVRFLLQGLDGRVDCAGQGPEVGMNDMIACIGARMGATYVDTYAPFRRGPKDLISKDGLHPSDDGYAVIARQFAKAVSDPPAPPRRASLLR